MNSARVAKGHLTQEKISVGGQGLTEKSALGSADRDSQRVKPYVALKNNVKEFFDIGRVLTNNISFAQNNEKSSYFLSFNNVDQKGIMPGTEYKRNSVKLSGTADISDKIYSSATINYIRSKGDLSVQGQGNSPMTRCCKRQEIFRCSN